MKIHYLAMILLSATLATGCGEKHLDAGIKPENMDTSVKPGDDFYQYANGTWMKNNPITAEYSRYGSFEVLAEKTREQLKEIIDEISVADNQPGTNAQKIADLYNMVMDTTRRNKDGYEPIKPLLERVNAMKSNKEVMPLITDLGLDGVAGFFSWYIDADQMSSSQNLLQTYQGGLSLGEKEYYLDTDEATTAIRDAFKKHVVKMFQLIGNDEKTATSKMESVMAIETKIAKASYSNIEQRDPIANYHKMTYDEFKKEYPTIDWDKVFEINGFTGVKELSVSQPEPLKTVEEIVNKTPLKDIKAYMEWQIIDGFASFLSSDIEEQNFDFYSRTMSGAQEQQPLWKRASSVVNGVLGEAMGQLYVERYFPPEAKARMETLVRNLQKALSQRIDAQDWMSNDTKAKAHEKLDAFLIKVGYPDKWKDYSGLVVDKNKSYVDNIMSINRFVWQDMLNRKLNKPVDREEWYMTPQTVNAYYNPTTNEICFPAGILQYPFFDMSADDAFNYGAIGVVIGHEMTHGFDDQGRQFDKDGNVNEWWTEQDAEQFKNKVNVLVDHFNKIEVLPGLFANGELTLGENIADHGGLMVSYQAFKNATASNPLPTLEGFTPEQRFFLAYAAVWAQNIREERIRSNTKSDVHSIGRWRVNGTLPHIDAWYDAFNIKEGDALYVPKSQRADIW
ncbi:MAG: M13 family metallopeptidase [Bacteroidales bacterium]|nr:M13 family metallopeptidase [Bacteroidales bacterium]